MLKAPADCAPAKRCCRESEDRYRRLVELSPEPLVVHANGLFAYVNPAAARLFGASDPAELIGQPVLNRVHPACLALIQEQPTSWLEPDVADIRERQLLRLDGQVIDAELVRMPVVYRGQPATRVIIRDISARKRAEEERVRLAGEQAARRGAEAAELRQAFLARAGTLLASSLDYETTLQQVARLAVPTLADYCLVYILDASAAPRLTAVAHTDPAQEVVLYELHARYPYDPSAGMPTVLRTGESVCYTAVTDEERMARAQDTDHLARLRALGAGSAMIVPLQAHGQTLGAISLVRTASSQSYGPDDLGFAEDLARRCALAVDNARLYWEAQNEIAERKRAEAEQQRLLAQAEAAETKFRRLLELAPDAVVVFNQDGRVVLTNRQVEALFGYRPEELVGQAVEVIIPERCRPAHRQRRARFMSEALEWPIGIAGSDVCGLRKDGSEFPAEITLNRVDGQDGPLIIAFVRDITERKRAEAERACLMAAVERERQTLAAIMASLTDGLIVFDDAGKVSYANAQAGQLFSTDPRQLSGKTPEEVLELGRLSLDDPAAAWVAWKQAVARLEERPSFELGLTGPSRRELLVQLFPVAAASGARVGVLLHDVSAERELVRTKDELVAMVSHELASPAGTLVSYAELLASHEYPAPEQREMLTAMVQEGQRLTTIIRDFLDVQRLKHGRLPINLRPVDLKALLQHAATVAGTDRDHPLVLDVPEGLPPVQADAQRVQQVLANLLSNAQKYTPAGGTVRLVARELDGAVEVSVADEGLGIPAEALPRLFEKFYRVDSADRRLIRGTGLGLAIARELIEAHGGQIGAESAGPGQGSRFWFTVPLAAALPRVAETGPTEPAPAAKTSTSRLRVLAVDDDPMVRSAASRLLRLEGHHVQTASSAEEALDRLRAEPFDVVLSDLRLDAGMDGYALAREVRREWPRVQFILASGSVGLDLAAAREHGVDALLGKPYGPEELRRLLDRIERS